MYSSNEGKIITLKHHSSRTSITKSKKLNKTKENNSTSCTSPTNYMKSYNSTYKFTKFPINSNRDILKPSFIYQKNETIKKVPYPIKINKPEIFKANKNVNNYINIYNKQNQIKNANNFNNFLNNI